MDHFFIAQIKINDQNEYEKYIERVDEVFNKFNGEYLAVEDSPKILEGNWKYTRTVLIKFESDEEFNKWYYSDEYQKILKHRLNAADCDSILIKGK
jgi:uncharacterized protein (DUF1330 family)